jgi:hypothetical protein
LRSILAIVALWKGTRVYARLLLDFGRESVGSRQRNIGVIRKEEDSRAFPKKGRDRAPTLSNDDRLTTNHYLNNCGASAIRFRLHTIHVCIPGVSTSSNFTSFVFSHALSFRFSSIR